MPLTVAWPDGARIEITATTSTTADLRWPDALGPVATYRLSWPGTSRDEAGTVTSLTALTSGQHLAVEVVAVAVDGTTTAPLRAEVAPATRLTAPDGDISTDFCGANAFLIQGSGPIPCEVLSVLVGHVRTRDGVGVPGLRVSTLGHPEWGSATSQADGLYALAVAAGRHTLEVRASAFIPIQRLTVAKARDFTYLPDTVVLRRDEKATSISTASGGFHSGTPQQDKDGARTTSVFIPAGTSSWLRLADGGAQPVTTLTLRATEATVGPSGPEAMPASLPGATAYTFAADLSADEALAAGAEGAGFATPVAVYADNFLRYAVGSAIPLGVYDEATGRWESGPNAPTATLHEVALPLNASRLVPSRDGEEVYAFDSRGRHLRTVSARTGLPLWIFAWGPQGLVSVTDVNGDVTSVDRRADGTAQALVAQDGQRTELTLNASGLVERVTDATGRFIEAAYFPGGLLSEWKDENGNATAFTWDDKGNLATHTNARGAKQDYGPVRGGIGFTSPEGLWRSRFDGVARTYDVTSPEGRIATATLDAKLRPLALLGPGVLPISYSYDPRGRLVSVTQGVRSETFTYDSNGFVASARNALNEVTSFALHKTGRVQKATRADDKEVTVQMDAVGNLTGVTPPDAGTHRFFYDKANLATTYSPPALPGVADETATFDRDALVTRAGHADSTETLVTREASGRVRQVTTPWWVNDFTYTVSTGQVASLARGTQRLEWQYDGFLMKEEKATGVAPATSQWTYDSDFRVASHSVGGVTVTYAYDADSLLTQAGAVTLGRIPTTGQLASVTVGIVTTVVTPNQYGELAALATTVNASELYSEGLSYDEAGRIAVAEEVVQGTAVQWVYGYDRLGQLTSVSKNGGAPAVWTYDGNGNRLTAEAIGSTFDAQDRLRTAGATVYEWDALGGRRTRTEGSAVTRYVDDGMGALISVSLPDTTAVSYEYDGRQRRVAKRRNGALVKRWVYDGQYRVVAEVDASGSVTSRFVFGSQSQTPDYLVRGGVTYSYVKNHLGSVRFVVDASSGVVAQRLDYDAWGNVTTDTAPDFQPFGFAGGIFDNDTRLTHFGFREYDASSGVWTVKDPIRLAGGMNLYAYALNSPIQYVDPDGRSPQSRIRIVERFRFLVDFMTRHHMRHENPYVNNVRASSPFRDELGCGGQADWLRRRLAAEGFEDYSFDLAGGRTGPYGLWPHQWIVAESSKDNSVLILDPWADSVVESPSFPGTNIMDWPGNHPMQNGGPWAEIPTSGPYPPGASSPAWWP